MQIDFAHLKRVADALSDGAAPYLPFTLGVGLMALGCPDEVVAVLAEAQQDGGLVHYRVLVLTDDQLIFVDAPEVPPSPDQSTMPGQGQKGWSRKLTEVVSVELTDIASVVGFTGGADLVLPHRSIRFRDGANVAIPLFGPTAQAYGWERREQFVVALLRLLSTR